jgi:hypothetical protein
VGIYSDPKHVILCMSNGEAREEFSIVLTARPLAGQPTPSIESGEVRWVPASEIPGYWLNALVPADGVRVVFAVPCGQALGEAQSGDGLVGCEQTGFVRGDDPHALPWPRRACLLKRAVATIFSLTVRTTSTSVMRTAMCTSLDREARKPEPNQEPTTPDFARPWPPLSDCRSAPSCGNWTYADAVRRIRRAWRAEGQGSNPLSSTDFFESLFDE